MLGLIYLFVGAFVFHAPVGGLVSPELENAPWTATKVLDLANHLIWPTIILGAAGTAQLIRIMRGNLLEILGQQFVTTARAKGLPETTVVNKYAVRVAINPLISVMGMQLPQLISGATILGIVLSLPTTGPLFLHPLANHDTYLAPYGANQRFDAAIYVPPQPIYLLDDGKIYPHILGLRQTVDLETLRRTYAPDPYMKIPIQFLVKGEPHQLFGLIPTDVHL